MEKTLHNKNKTKFQNMQTKKIRIITKIYYKPKINCLKQHNDLFFISDEKNLNEEQLVNFW